MADLLISDGRTAPVSTLCVSSLPSCGRPRQRRQRITSGRTPIVLHAFDVWAFLLEPGAQPSPGLAMHESPISEPLLPARCQSIPPA